MTREASCTDSVGLIGAPHTIPLVDEDDLISWGEGSDGDLEKEVEQDARLIATFASRVFSAQAK